MDANRPFSALLKDGSTRTAIYETSAQLFAPVFLLEEIANHHDELRRRTALAPDDLDHLVDELAQEIMWVPDDAIRPHLPAAYDALGAVDVQDVPYLACALAVGADGIWSHDRHFDKQELVPRVSRPGNDRP